MDFKSIKTLTFLLCLTSVILIGYGYTVLSGSKENAQEALRDLKSCHGYVATIKNLKAKDSLIVTNSLPKSTLSSHITNKVKSLGLKRDVFNAIYMNSQDNRVGDSNYVEYSHRLVINEVTLEQLIQILHDTKQKNPGLWVEELSLTANVTAQNSLELWNSTIKLNYLVYKPIKTN